ncbi:MAG TPA: hypothetical protein VF808_16655 [Ktedonobacterales bacterium]
MGLRVPQQAASLTYDRALHMWVYVAPYDDLHLCKRRAAALQMGIRLPFVCVRIGLEPTIDNKSFKTIPQRYIPGWYAATYADPRPVVTRPVS